MHDRPTPGCETCIALADAFDAHAQNDQLRSDLGKLQQQSDLLLARLDDYAIELEAKSEQLHLDADAEMEKLSGEQTEDMERKPKASSVHPTAPLQVAAEIYLLLAERLKELLDQTDTDADR